MVLRGLAGRAAKSCSSPAKGMYVTSVTSACPCAKRVPKRVPSASQTRRWHGGSQTSTWALTLKASDFVEYISRVYGVRPQYTVGNRPTARPEICVTVFLLVLNSSKGKKLSDNQLKCSNLGLFWSILGKFLTSEANFLKISAQNYL